MAQEPWQPLTASVPAEIAHAVDQARGSLTRSAWVRRAIEAYLADPASMPAEGSAGPDRASEPEPPAIPAAQVPVRRLAHRDAEPRD